MFSSKIDENLYSVMERKSYIELCNNGGYFSKFDYTPADYSSFKEMVAEEARRAREKITDLHGRAPFLVVPTKQINHKHFSEF